MIWKGRQAAKWWLAGSVAWLPWMAVHAQPSGPPGASPAPTTDPAGMQSSRRADPRALGLLGRSDLDRGAVLTTSATVEFDLPPNASSARILLNPGVSRFEALRSSRLADPRLRLRYAVQLEAIGSHGKTVLIREHSFRRDLLEAILPDGARTTGAFYLDPAAPTPLSSDELLLDFQGLATPGRLRLRLLSADAAVADVLVRGFAPAPVSRRDAAVQWQRLSPEQRARMASGNLFPPQVLAQEERERLVVSRWAPVAPRRGASMRELYVVRNLPTTKPVDVGPPPLPGLPLTAGRVATLPLPEHTRAVRLQLTPRPLASGSKAGSAAPRTAADPLVVRWSGENAFQRSTSTHPWSGQEVLELNLPTGPGWLEVETRAPAALRVWNDTPGSTAEITPEPAFLRLWRVTPDVSLVYDITHAGGEGTPLRLSLRRISSMLAPATAAPAQIELLKADGSVYRRTSVAVDPARSKYDQLAPEAPDLEVTEPTEAFFRLPSAVTQVRVSGTEALLAAAYTRPPNLPRQVRTPEDSLAAAGEQGPVPAWFPLRPLDHETRLVEGRFSVLRVQSRPPEDRPELAAGNYFFEDFDPVAGGAARVFLSPREAGVPDRDEALAATFRPLPSDGRVRLRGFPGRRAVQPRIAWASSSSMRQLRYRIMVNGKAVREGAAAGIAGEILLPQMAPGDHVVRVQAGGETPVRWWINHNLDGDPWVRRQAHQLDRPLAFEVERKYEGREFLSVRTYQPSGVREPLRLRVRIEAPPDQDEEGPLPGWLFAERLHEIRPTGELALPVAETESGQAEIGRTFFIPFPEGAARGRYRIVLLPQTPAGWVTLSRVTPGLVPQRRLTLEGSFDAQ